tara:strand:+ start:208 stop:684 length:477 start_codon:yes stop_codon:yes gene_type:complete
MKKLLLLLFCLTLLSSSCKKDEEEQINNNYTIVGNWRPDSVIVNLTEEEFSPSGQLLDTDVINYTTTPDHIGIYGDIQLSSEGIAIIEFADNNVDTGTYVVSENDFTHFMSNGNLGAIFTYSVSKNNLILNRSMDETDWDDDGYEIYTREENLYLTRQ